MNDSEALGNVRERRERLGSEATPQTDKSQPHAEPLTPLEWMMSRHESAPPEKVVLTDKDYRPRPGTPGTPEWLEARERERAPGEAAPARDEKAPQ